MILSKLILQYDLKVKLAKQQVQQFAGLACWDVWNSTNDDITILEEVDTGARGRVRKDFAWHTKTKLFLSS